jgi:RNA polymerase sigma-70 factor (ECF subfamily)
MAIDALKERLREPFLLVEVFGMTYADAAVVLQTKVGTVKSRVFRARQVLIASLADEDEQGETREQR